MKRFGAIWVAVFSFFLAVAVQAESPAAEKSPRFDVKFDQGRVSVTAVDAEIADILTEIARQANAQLTFDRRPQGKVSIRLEKLSVAEALKSLTAY